MDECAGNIRKRTFRLRSRQAYSGILRYTNSVHQGFTIESCSNNGEWALLGRYTQKPTYDDSPLAVPDTPESRDYRMRWWDKDESHGEWSAVQTVLVGGEFWRLAIANDLCGILDV